MARDRKDKSTVNFLARMDLDEYLDPDWNIPTEYPDLTGYRQIAVDLETRDPAGMGASRWLCCWHCRSSRGLLWVLPDTS